MSTGIIYVLTNPSFPEYVKIGYADNLEKRLSQLNRSECLPFAFRAYCTYEVEERLTDKEVHNIIDTLNPDLRSVETFGGKTRTKEFFRIEPEKVYEILKSIATLSNSTDRLKIINQTDSEKKDEIIAKENEESVANGVYTEETHLEKASYEAQALYNKLKARILELNHISLEPRKLYIAFKVNGGNVCSVIFQQRKLKVVINIVSGLLDDPKELAKDVKGIGHWATGDYIFELSNDGEIDYLMSLIKQAYDAQVGLL